MAVVMATAGTALAQPKYTAVDLGTLGGTTYATGINASGQVVGWSGDRDFFYKDDAFLYSRGAMIDLGGASRAEGINASGQVVGMSAIPGWQGFLYSGGAMSTLGNVLPYGINAGGQVVGVSDFPPNYGHPRAFLYSGGVMVNLGCLAPVWFEGARSEAHAINASGQVAGWTDIGWTAHAFLYSGGTMIDLGTLGGHESKAQGINASGQVVGYALTSTGDAHAFLSSGGGMSDLGTLGGSASAAYGINASGQVVGYSLTSAGATRAFLYSGGAMTDLNSLVALPSGVYLKDATSINDRGQIAANGSDGHPYLLTPGFKVTNPFQPYALGRLAPQLIDAATALNSPAADSLAADGISAVVLAFQSNSSKPVDFTVTASATDLLPGTFVASLSAFDPDYLTKENPNPPELGQPQEVKVTDSTCDASGTCTFLALLWGPNAMPVPNNPVASLKVTATQQGGGSSETTVTLRPPPLLLVHGIWSSAASAGFAVGSGGFYDWLAGPYPPNQILGVDYSAERSRAFDDPQTQEVLLQSMGDALAFAAASGMAARKVDVVGHSMGGLVARYFLSTGGSMGNPALLPNPIHKLITIGTPHQGSPLATTLVLNQKQPTVAAGPVVYVLCLAFSSCTLRDAMGVFDKQVDTGVQSLEPNSQQLRALSTSNEFSAIVGQAPTPLSLTEVVLDLVLNAFLPGQTVTSILGGPANDTIVPIASQNPGQTDSATFPGIVHARICLPGTSACTDVDETHSVAVWQQAYYWLTGGSGPAPAPHLASPSVWQSHGEALAATASPPPVLDLIGYTQVPASNVTISPGTGSVLTINSATNITAASSSKTIAEVLLLQTVADPTDTPMMFATQSPFTIVFTPRRLGSADLAALTVFGDKTYAVTALSYILQPQGSPLTLTLVNAPVASMSVGSSRVVGAKAVYAAGPLEVTQAAAYTTGSGTSNVIEVSAGGTITATGNGEDRLNVSYGGLTASAQVIVGACTYSLSPLNLVVPYTGGPIAIQVTSPVGCAWTATGGSNWLSLTNPSGVGNGSIGLAAAANNSGNTETATIALAGITAAVTQPATACTYGVSQSRINAPAAGTTGTITVTTSCPVVVSSDVNWVTASGGGSPVIYTVAPNNGGAERTATLTIGTQTIPVLQAGWVIPGLTGSSLNPSSASAGGPAFTLTITGTNFVSGAVVEWNGAALITTSVSATQLTATVPAALIASAGTANVTVVNPDRATSAAAMFTISAAPVLLSPANGATGVLVAPTLIWNASAGATYDVYFGASSPPPLMTTTTGTTYAPGALSSGATYYWQVAARSGSGSASSPAWSFTTGVPAIGSRFVPVAPCRVAETRNPAGPFGGPTMTAGSTRSFTIPASGCNIPATAQAYSLNVTVVPAGPLSYLTLWPSGQPQPLVSTLNSFGGIVVANAAIVPAGSGGAVSVFVSNQTDVILDINGYFDSTGAVNLSSFYPAAPCRVADTRGNTGTFGGPSVFGGQSRDFPVPLSSCSVPATSTAYSLNVTAIPDASFLSYLTTWPTGSSRPFVSTLNSWTGKVVANAAIVPAGTNGSISVFVTDPTNVVLDIDGYFGQPGNPGALAFYPVTPCRVADTRNADGPFGGPEVAAASTRSFAIPASGCSVPSTAAAYSVNVTVVPDAVLSYLTTWPTGSSQPLVSTLNSFDGAVVANAAIVPAGTNGAISIFVTNLTHVILDINGYFAP